MINIKLNEEENFDLDMHDLPLGSDLDSLINLINDNDVDVETQHRIAYAYKNYPESCLKVLKNTLNKNMFGNQEKTLCLMLALQLQLKMDCTDTFKKLENCDLVVFNILKGFHLLSVGKYERAMFLFRTAKYQLGMQICSYYINVNSNEIYSNKVVRAYARLRDMKNGCSRAEIDEVAELLGSERQYNLLYKMGYSNRYADAGNIDVKIAKIERLFYCRNVDEDIDGIGSGGLESSEKMFGDIKVDVNSTFYDKYKLYYDDASYNYKSFLLKNKEEILNGLEAINENTEATYLQAKLYHMLDDRKEAKLLYKRCLELDPGYAKARYMLCRLEQRPFDNFKATNIADFNAIMQYKRGAIPDIGYCSEKIKDYILAVTAAKKNNDAALYRYAKLLKSDLVEGYVVKNNVAYFMFRYKTSFSESVNAETKMHEVRNTRKGSMDIEASDEAGKGNVGTSKRGDLSRKKVSEVIVELLREGLDEAPVKLKPLLQYNLCYVTNCFSVDLDIPEYKILKAYKDNSIEYFKETGNFDLLAYFHLKNKETGLAKAIFMSGSSVYAQVSLGNLFMQSYFKDKNKKYLSKAIEIFRKNLGCYYAANGIGICLANLGRISDAVKVFTNLGHNEAILNLAYTYIISGNHKEAVLNIIRYLEKSNANSEQRYVSNRMNISNDALECNTSVVDFIVNNRKLLLEPSITCASHVCSLSPSLNKLLYNLCKRVGEPNLTKQCIKVGAKSMKNLLVEQLLNNNEIYEAEKLGIETKLQNLYEEKKKTLQKTSEVTRRKIEIFKQKRRKKFI